MATDVMATARGARTPPWWIIVCLGIGSFVAAFTVERLFDDELPVKFADDMRSYFLPAMTFLRQSLADGELPLWNPYQLAGTPFLAVHSPGALYPLLLVFAPLPPQLALALHAISHFALAGLFTALFARKIGLSAGASLAAGLTYMASPPVVSALHNTAYLSTFVWLPLILLTTEGMCRRPGRRSAVLMAIPLAMSFLSGHAQAFLYSVYTMALYGIARTVTLRAPNEWQPLLRWTVVAGALAVGLIAVQLLPTLSHAAGAVRDLDGLGHGEVFFSKFRWSRWPAMLCGWGGGAASLPYLFAPLALAALLGRRRALALTFLAILVLSWDFMTGVSGIGWKIYWVVPGIKVFRFASRIGFVYHFAAAMLIGLGASSLISAVRRRRPSAAWILVVAIPVVVGVDLWARNPLAYRFQLWQPMWGASSVRKVTSIGRQAGFQRVFVQAGFGTVAPRKIGMLQGIYSISDYDPILPGAYAQFLDLPPGSGWHGSMHVFYPNAASYSRDPAVRSRARARYQRQLQIQPPSRLDLLSTRYYIDATGSGDQLSRLPAVVGGKYLAGTFPPVYERPQALPRAYLVKDVITVESEIEALALVHELRFDPRRTAVVVGDVTLSSEPLAETEFTEIESVRRNTVTLYAHCDSACLLVLTDLYDPDWGVRVDGEVGEILRTNFLVRGVRLDSGTHRVVFHYCARAFWAGAAITFVSLLAALALMWRSAPTTAGPADARPLGNTR